MFKECLNDKTIAEYFSKKTSFWKKYRIKKHIENCENCLNELLIYHQMLKLQKVENWEKNKISEEKAQQVLFSINQSLKTKHYKWKEPKNIFNNNKLVNFINKSMQHKIPGISLSPVLQPVPVLRSISSISNKNVTDPSVLIQKQIDELDINILLTNSIENFADIQISILQNNMKALNVRVIVDCQDKGFDSRLIKNKEIFYNCPFGHYRFTIIQHGMEKGLIEFEINQDGVYEK